LAAYCHFEVWIFRLVFALPLIASLLTSIFRHSWFGFHDFHDTLFFTGGFGGSLILVYVVLWMVLPEASTASEKLEMRGEKVDLESIKNTIKGDLEHFKGRAKDIGAEMGERFQKVGEDMRRGTQNFATETAPIARSAGHGIGHAIGVLFKVFFLIIAGIIAFALTMALIALFFGGAGVLNFKAYIIDGFWPNVLIWASFLLFLIIPVLALLTWLIRRMTGARSRRHYLGYIFATLWVIGLFSFITLAVMVLNNFRYRQHVEEEVPLTQPSHGKLVIRAVGNTKNFYEYEDDRFDFRWDRHNFFNELNEDSMTLKTVRIVLVKSADSNFHVQLVRFSRGNDTHLASQLASQIQFPVRQNDSILYLPDGFTVSRYQQFRNQQVLVTVAVPVGKRIMIDRNTENYNWFTINVSRHHYLWGIHRDDHRYGDMDQYGDEDSDWGTSYSWSSNTEYMMTDNGLIRTDKNATKEKDEKEHKNIPPSRREGGGYRYHKDQDSSPIKHTKDTTTNKSTTAVMDADQSICLISALANLN
jgi:heme/copper-type cytochrome/quinol oxidase subunit 2